ncbi:hypothetical protein QFC22_001666 [Naganishia vaughanmartiniae]|uniref:Uncharacterized protein n=1 Tax=Naganishia vaughanmartiniae TaxID=1424756 RepID=A0ACC2XGS5_9TREE|nr:hypothetical protein QFC22_001666 [Naganishia vaughanmartiniae]
MTLFLPTEKLQAMTERTPINVPQNGTRNRMPRAGKPSPTQQRSYILARRPSATQDGYQAVNTDAKQVVNGGEPIDEDEAGPPPRSSPRLPRESFCSDDSPSGVNMVEAAQAVWNKRTSIALASYIYSLDGMTSWQYMSYATSTVLKVSLSGTITTAAAIIIAVGKPFMAKLADVFGRGETYIAVTICYCVGYTVIATAHSIGQIATGNIIYSFGYTGLQIMSQIIMADMTTLRWRGLSTSLLSLPFIVNNFVSAEITEAILPNWRWGYGMFAVIVPICLIPVIGSLMWAQNKAKKQLKSARRGLHLSTKSRLAAAWDSFQELDIVGLVLVATSLALILLPLTLSANVPGGWHNNTMRGMLLGGLVLFPIFCWYETKFPRLPLVPYRFLRNKSILGACLIGFFDFVSFYLQYTNLYNFIYVTQDWSYRNLTYFASCQTLSLTVFGIVGGTLMAKYRDVKWTLFAGLLIRLAGVTFMLRSRGAHGTPLELVANQVLQGLGGGLACVALQVSAQADVVHADVATVTAMVLLITEVGNSVGSAIATSIFTNRMPIELAKHVPTTNQTLLNDLYQSILVIDQYPKGDPIRDGAIKAYSDVMFIQVLSAVVVAILPPIVCYYMIQPIRLEDVQNMRDGKSLTGRQTKVSQRLGAATQPGDIEEGVESEDTWECDAEEDESSDSESGILERVTSRTRRSSFFA